MWNPFAPKSKHTEVRYVHSSRHEQTEAQRRYAARKASVVAQLAVYAACTTPEQRRLEAEQFFAKARSEALRRSVGRGG